MVRPVKSFFAPFFNDAELAIVAITLVVLVSGELFFTIGKKVGLGLTAFISVL
jgi:hypothetical protein